MGLTLTLSESFYEGGALAAEGVPHRLPVSIGDHAYQIEVAQYRRGVVDQLRPPTDQGSEPGEQSYNTQGLWKRSQSDWSLGAGQLVFDDPQESTRRRFRASVGVDPWTRNKLSLLHATQAKAGGPGAGATMVAAIGTRLYVASGSNLFFTSNPEAASPTWSTIAVGSPVLDFTSDGAFVYIATAAGIYRVTLGSTTLGAVWLAGAYLVIRYANGRLLAATASVLNEISPTPTATVVKTLTFTGYVWVGIAAAPNGIYAWASSNDTTEIYFIGVNETTGALDTAILAGTTPNGETLNVMEFYGGAMVQGTTVGLRLATIGGDGGLTYGPAIEVGNVRDLDQRGQFCWFAWEDFVDPDDIHWGGLGRADLAHWTEEMVPAYATDLMVQTAAPSRGVAYLGGRHYFTIEGVGLYGENLASLVAEGQLYSGHIHYGTFERKIVSSIDVRTEPLDGEVGMHLHLENGDHLDVASHNVQDSMGPPSSAVAQGADGESVEVHLELLRDASVVTEGPVLKRWTLRALPTPSVSEEFLVPIILHDKVRNDRGLVIRYDPLEEYRYLLGLVNSKATVRYQEGGASYTVYVSRVEVQPDSWNDSVQFFEGLLMVRLVTIQPDG